MEDTLQIRKVLSIIGKYRSIKEQASELLRKLDRLDDELTIAIDKREDSLISYASSDVEKNITTRMNQTKYETSVLIDSYNKSISGYAQETLVEIQIIDNKGKTIQAVLREIIVGCDAVLTSLEGVVSPLTNPQLDSLNHLKKEVQSLCENLDISFQKNLDESINELEKGHFLASALISSRIIVYMLSQMSSFSKLKGNSIQEKINYLESIVKLPSDKDSVKMELMKTEKIARNLFSHDIKVYAEPSDAFSLLSGCLLILRVFIIAYQEENK